MEEPAKPEAYIKRRDAAGDMFCNVFGREADALAVLVAAPLKARIAELEAQLAVTGLRPRAYHVHRKVVALWGNDEAHAAIDASIKELAEARVTADTDAQQLREGMRTIAATIDACFNTNFRSIAPEALAGVIDKNLAGLVARTVRASGGATFRELRDVRRLLDPINGRPRLTMRELAAAVSSEIGQAREAVRSAADALAERKDVA